MGNINTGTLRCCTCGHYINPQRKMEYPNCDNEALGWVTCGTGSTIKKNTMACSRHTALAQGTTKGNRSLVHKPAGRRLIK